MLFSKLNIHCVSIVINTTLALYRISKQCPDPAETNCSSHEALHLSQMCTELSLVIIFHIHAHRFFFFTVKMQLLIEKNTNWKTGVFLHTRHNFKNKI